MLREIPRPPSSRANSQPRRLLVRSASPEEEAIAFLDDPGDPADESFGWSPLQWVAEKASAAAGVVAGAGRAIYNQVIKEAGDVVDVLNAAAFGIPAEDPGPLYTFVTGAAESFNRILPERIQEKLGTVAKDNIAGYITLPDGTRVPVAKYQDNTAQGDRAISDSLKASLRSVDLRAAADRAKTKLETQKLAVSSDQFQQALELKLRADARDQSLHELQVRAANLALDKQTVMNRGPGWWNLPSRLAWEEEPPQRVIRAIGPGVAGGIQIGKSRWSTD